MVDRTSRVLLLVESILFLLPLSFLSVGYAWYLSILLSDITAEDKVATQQLLIALLVAIAIQAIAWFEIGRFVAHGRTSLSRVSGFSFITLLATACTVLIGLASAIADSFGSVVDEGVLGTILMVAVSGAPALIPFTHFTLEYRYARSYAEDRREAN